MCPINGRSQRSFIHLVTRIHYQEIEKNILDVWGFIIGKCSTVRKDYESLTFQPARGN